MRARAYLLPLSFAACALTFTALGFGWGVFFAEGNHKRMEEQEGPRGLLPKGGPDGPPLPGDGRPGLGKDRKGNQRFRCLTCRKTFSERPERPLGAMQLPLDKALL